MPIADVLLVVEIADTSLDTDLLVKAPLYAAAGLPEYWVVDVENRAVHVLSGPAADGYRKRDQVAFGGVLGSATILGVSIDTNTI